MAIKIGQPTVFTLVLDSGGQPINIPSTATVTAQVMTSDGATALSAVISVLSTEIGADFQAGVIVIELSETDTASITAPECGLLVTVTNVGNSRDWLSTIDVEGDTVERSALFIRDDFITRFRSHRLPRIRGYLDDDLTDDYLWDKLKAAEADAQRELHVFLVPTVLFPNEPTQAEIDALAGAPWAVDPGYDYDQDLLQPGGWTFLALRQKPVITLESVKFYFPTMGTVFTVPSTWTKIDKKYGHVRFIPAGSVFSMPMGSMMVSAMGMQAAPQFIEVRYTAGLRNAPVDYPDLLDLIQRMVMLRLVTDAFLPGSSSISADGLSQSQSPPDLEKMQAAIDKSLETLRTRIHGVPLMVL